jgi:hypothetical protein
VADAILHSAEHPERDVVIGGAGKLISAGGRFAPRLMDRLSEAAMFGQQKTPRPPHREGILDRPARDLSERQPYPERHIFESSAYTTARLHALLTGMAILGAGLGMAALWGALGSGERTATARG